jgi:hypothetical protein
MIEHVSTYQTVAVVGGTYSGPASFVTVDFIKRVRILAFRVSTLTFDTGGPPANWLTDKVKISIVMKGGADSLAFNGNKSDSNFMVEDNRDNLIMFKKTIEQGQPFRIDFTPYYIPVAASNGQCIVYFNIYYEIVEDL